MQEVRVRKFEVVRSEGPDRLTAVVDYGSGEHQESTVGDPSGIKCWDEEGHRRQCVLRFLESLAPSQVVAVTEGEAGDGKALTFVYYRVGS
jgi:hypothetical protein